MNKKERNKKMIKEIWDWLVGTCKPLTYMITGLIVIVNLGQASNYTPLLGGVVLAIFMIPSFDLLIKHWVSVSD